METHTHLIGAPHASWHPVSPLIPTDWDFGRVIDDVLPEDPDKAIPSQLRYDMAVERWLRRTLQILGKTPPIVMAAPMNAFAAYDQLYRRSCPNRPENAQPPLPFVSVEAKAPQLREGSAPVRILRGMSFIDDEEARRASARYGVTYMRYPKPLTYPYTIHIWALTKSHLHLLGERLEETFWDDRATFLVETPWVKDDRPVSIYASAKKVSADDASDLARSNGEERLLRFVVQIEVEGWMWFDTLRAPTVHRNSQEILVKGPGETNAQAELDTILTADLTGVAKPALFEQPLPVEPLTDGVTTGI